MSSLFIFFCFKIVRPLSRFGEGYTIRRFEVISFGLRIGLGLDGVDKMVIWNEAAADIAMTAMRIVSHTRVVRFSILKLLDRCGNLLPGFISKSSSSLCSVREVDARGIYSDIDMTVENFE
jgi:hypothetical protein